MHNLRLWTHGEASPSPASWMVPTGLVIALAGVYFLAARLSLVLLTKPDGVAVFWPAAGIASGTLIALGPRARLPVSFAVAIASASASLLRDRNLTAGIAFALCNGLETLLVGWLIQHHFCEDFKLNSLPSVFAFFASAP